MSSEIYHTPVLLIQTLTQLNVRPEGIYLDATLGGGGHSEEILKQLGPNGRLVGIDADPDAILYASSRLAKYQHQCILIRDRFSNLKSVLLQHSIDSISGALFDLGVSSHQLDKPEKGFSFRAEAKLDMRMDPDAGLDAKMIINTYDRDALAELFWNYGEEKNSRRIAKAIDQNRKLSPIETTRDLAYVVEKSVGTKNLTKTLARVFQALRIEVNNELGQLKKALVDAAEVLQSDGRIVVISYHSLEDRIVKQFFRDAAAIVQSARHRLEPSKERTPILRILTKRPVEADEKEIQENPRSRSAKLRAAEKI